MYWRPHRTEFVLRLLWWRFFVKIQKNIGIYSGAEWGVVFSRQNWKSCLCLLFRLNTIQYYQSSIENNYPWRKCCSYLLIFNSIWLLYLSIQLSYFQGRIRNLVCVYYSNCVLSNTINYSLSWTKCSCYLLIFNSVWLSNFLRFHSNFAKKKKFLIYYQMYQSSDRKLA